MVLMDLPWKFVWAEGGRGSLHMLYSYSDECSDMTSYNSQPEIKICHLPWVNWEIVIHAPLEESSFESNRSCNAVISFTFLTNIRFWRNPDNMYFALGPVHPHQQRQRPLLWQVPCPGVAVHVGSHGVAGWCKQKKHQSEVENFFQTWVMQLICTEQ